MCTNDEFIHDKEQDELVAVLTELQRVISQMPADAEFDFMQGAIVYPGTASWAYVPEDER